MKQRNSIFTNFISWKISNNWIFRDTCRGFCLNQHLYGAVSNKVEMRNILTVTIPFVIGSAEELRAFTRAFIAVPAASNS